MDAPEKTLEEIRELLGDLPTRLADVLSKHESRRYGGGHAGEEDEEQGGQTNLFGGRMGRRRGTAAATSLTNMASTLGGVTHGIGKMFGKDWGDVKGFDWFKKAAAEAFGETPRRPQPIPSVLAATPPQQAVHKVWIDGPLPLPVSIQGGVAKGGAGPSGPLALPSPPLITPPPSSSSIRALPPPTALNQPTPRPTTVTTLSGSPLALGSSPAMPAWLQQKLQPPGHSAAPGTRGVSAPPLLGPPPILPRPQLALPAPPVPGRALAFYASANRQNTPSPERLTKILSPAPPERPRVAAPLTALAPAMPPPRLANERPAKGLGEDQPRPRVEFFHGPPRMPESLAKVYSHRDNVVSSMRQGSSGGGNMGQGESVGILKELITELRELKEEMQRSNRDAGPGGQQEQRGPPGRPKVFINGEPSREGTLSKAVPKMAQSHFAQGPWVAAAALKKLVG